MDTKEHAQGMYSSDRYPESEMDRLKRFGYPNERTMKVLDGIALEDTSFLDVGSGPNPALGDYIRRRGADYVPLDLNREALLQVIKGSDNMPGGILPIQGNVLQLPFKDASIDTVFQRFVLMHMPPPRQKIALEELQRVAKKRVISAEYDWSTFDSTEHKEPLEEFKTLAYDLIKRVGGDPTAAEQLPSLAEKIAPEKGISTQRFSREEGDYSNELVMLARSSAQTARRHPKVMNNALAEQFDRLGERFKLEPIQFTPPDIVFVTIEK